MKRKPRNFTLSQLIKRLQSFEEELGDQEVCLKVCGDRSCGAANATRDPPVSKDFKGRGICIWSDE